VTSLLHQAEEILETAVQVEDTASGMVILVDRQGGLRTFDAAGWTLAGIAAEFGAASVFKVQRSPELTSVEAWSGHDRLRIERQTGQPMLPLVPTVRHPITLTTAPLSIKEPDAAAWMV